MLQSLHVGHYVLIDSLEISFPEGFVVLTGQTGAGKSILLGALSLLMGAKADPEAMISPGADGCVVEGTFDVRGQAALEALLKDEDLDWGGGLLTIRRVLNRSGRSRAFVNDEPVSLPVLQALSAHLIDIHSQHQTLLLTDRRTQLSMLDYYAGTTALLEQYKLQWRTVQSTRAELKEVREKALRLQQEQDYLQARYTVLSEARLREGELEELEAEQQLLAHAEQIKESLCRVESLLSGEEEGRSLNASLKEAERLLEKAGGYLPGLNDLAGRLSSVRIEAADILDEVSSANARTEVSTGRLEAVDARLGTLYELMRRYGVSTLAELIAERDRLSDLLGDGQQLTDRQEELEKSLAAAEKALTKAAGALSKARTAAASPFAEEVLGMLRSLELPQAAFTAELAPVEPGPDGADALTFRFSATRQQPLVEVARCASGGELSRIMLCLKALLARYTQMPTLVFDEIDTGVSGSVADKMGAMLSGMGATGMQVFAITHLPQVAARGTAHFLVEKKAEGPAAVTTIRPLASAPERVQEIARLLSGSVVTPAALENAKSLLREAGTSK